MAQSTKSTVTKATTIATTTTGSLQELADQSNEAPYRDWEMVNDDNVSLESSKQELGFTPKSEKPKRRHDPNYHYVEGEIPLESMIISSTLASKNNQQQTERIVAKFNEGIDISKVFYDDPIRGKRVEPGFYKIYSWNNEAVIVPPSDQMVARVLYPMDVTQQVTSHGLVSQNSSHIVNRGKHVVMVPQGFIAKASIGNNLIFLGQGPHVIKDANFIFNADTGLVSLNEEYISHGTYHIISVPSGKIAKIILDGVPELLPSRSAPYVFNNSRFQIIKEGASYFEIATKKLIIHGSIKRLIVDTGEVAMISNNGKLEIIEPKADISEPIIINSEYVRVNPDPFVSTNLQTIIFPQGKNVYESAQTADGVLVKMKLMITYRIKDPMLAIQQLNTPAKILEHIEYCALTDMRNATQSCNYYAIQQSESSRAPQGTQQYYQHIQDELKAKLKDELLLIGVDLGRLAFEEFVIDDKRVQDQRSSNAQAIANTTAQVSNMEQERTLKLQTEETKLQVSRLHLEQAKLAEISRAQVDFEKSQIMMKQENLQVEAKALQDNMKIKYKVENENAMKLLEAQNKLEVARLEAEAKRVMAETDRDVMRFKGEVYQQYPQLFQLELAKIQAAAIAGVQTNVISPEVAQNLLGQLGTMNGSYLYPQQPQFALAQQQQPQQALQKK